MKKLALFVTLLILLKPVVPLLEYMVNYKYISKVLCINKEKPKMDCNGKCYLMKKLAKEETEQSPISAAISLFKKGELLYYKFSSSNILLGFEKQNYIKSSFRYNNLYRFLTSASVFHPPSFFV